MPNILVSPAGKFIDVADDDIENAKRLGYTAPDAAQKEELSKRAKYGEGLGTELRAGLEGAARGATFGLSDQLLTRSGLADKEGLAERKERNPLSEGVGEGAGIIGASLATGGLEDIGAGVRGVSALGEGVTGLAQRGVAAASRAAGTEIGERGLAARAIGTGLAHGAGSAVEGALYGAGQTISEQALGDPNALGEKALAHVGLGAVFGGIGGGALGALGEFAGLSKLAKAAGRSAQESGAAPEEIAGASSAEGAVAPSPPPEMGEAPAQPAAEAPPTPESAQPGMPGAEPEGPAPIQRGTLGSALRRLASRATGVSEGEVDQLLASGPEGEAARHAALHGVSEEETNKASRALADAISENEKISRDVTEQALGGYKLDRVAQIVPKDAVEHQLGAAQSLFTSARALLKDAQSEPGIYQGNTRKLESLISDYEARVEKAVASGEDVGAKTFISLDQFKRQLGPLAKPGRNATTAEDSFAGKVRELYLNEFKPTLEDQQVWGDAGKLQRDVNEKWTAYLNNNRQFKEHFLAETGSDRFNPVFEGDPSKTNAYLRNLTKPSNDLRHQYLTSHVGNQEALLKEIQQHFDLPAGQATKIAKLAENNAGLKASLKRIERDTQLHEHTRDVMSTSKSILTHIRNAAAVGGLHAGPAGVAIGGAVGALSGAISNAGNIARMVARSEGAQNAVRQAAKLAGVEKASLKVDKTIASAMDGYFEKIGTTALQRGPAASVNAMTRLFFKDGGMSAANDNKHVAYKARLAELAELNNNPSELLSRIQNNLGGLDSAAPHTASALQMTALRGLQYLQSKAPTDPIGGQNVNPSHSTWIPSDAELATFERHMQAVQHPLTLLDDLKTGTISPEAVEAVSTVYPTLYRQMITAAMPHMADAKDIPLQKRLQLATLLQGPVDAATSPGFAASMQSMYQATAIPAGPSKPTASPANQRAAISRTPLQRALANT